MIGGGIGAFRARSVRAGRAGEWRESRPDRQRIRRSIAFLWDSKGFVILRPGATAFKENQTFETEIGGVVKRAMFPPRRQPSFPLASRR